MDHLSMPQRVPFLANCIATILIFCIDLVVVALMVLNFPFNSCGISPYLRQVVKEINVLQPVEEKNLNDVCCSYSINESSL